MCMKNIGDFLKDEDGAVVVDWVVLTAGIVGLAMTVMLSIAAGLDSSAAALSDDVVLAAEQAGAL